MVEEQVGYRKALLRQQAHSRALAAAAARRPQSQRQLYDLWEELPPAGWIASFTPLSDEPDISRLNQALLEEGRLLLPGDRGWVSAAGQDGTLIPSLVIVPGLAFTPMGARLGRGGGWYDQSLSALSSDQPVWGVCWRENLLAGLPTTDQDRPVHRVISL